MKSYKVLDELCDTKTDTKEFTTHVESFNSRIRNYLARFQRRSFKYSKSVNSAMIELQALAVIENTKPKNFNDFVKLFPFYERNKHKSKIFTQKV